MLPRRFDMGDSVQPTLAAIVLMSARQSRLRHLSRTVLNALAVDARSATLGPAFGQLAARPNLDVVHSYLATLVAEPYVLEVSEAVDAVKKHLTCWEHDRWD